MNRREKRTEKQFMLNLGWRWQRSANFRRCGGPFGARLNERVRRNVLRGLDVFAG